MDKYIALENLSNGINKGDEFPASRLSPSIINALVAKKRIKILEREPIGILDRNDFEPVETKPKKRKYTKRSK